jgi:hypothetical protein
MDADFSALVAPHRREITAHCYRMTGSLAATVAITAIATPPPASAPHTIHRRWMRTFRA